MATSLLSAWFAPKLRKRSLSRNRLAPSIEQLESRSLLTLDAFSHTLAFTLPANANISSVLVGDFNRDLARLDDIASFDSNTGNWHVSLNRASPNQGTFDTSVWTTYQTTMGWQTHVVGDFSGDGRADIASFHPFNGTWWLSIANSTGTGFLPQALWADYAIDSGWQSHLVADFDGNGRPDIASFQTSDGTWRISFNPTGTGFLPQITWGQYATTLGWQTHLVGDFDGNNRPDIASFHPFNGTWWVSTNPFGGGFFPQQQWADFMNNDGWTYQAAADFNFDGITDIVNFHPINNTWHVSESIPELNPATAQTRQFVTTEWGRLPPGNFGAHTFGRFTGVDRFFHAAAFDISTGSWHVGRSNFGQFLGDLWDDFATSLGWQFQRSGNFFGFINVGLPGAPQPIDGILNFHPFNNAVWLNRPRNGLVRDHGAGLTIPTGSFVTSTLNVSGLIGTIADVNVIIRVRHGEVGQVSLFLISPQGTRVELSSNNGFFDEDYEFTTFDDEAPLSIRGGVPPYRFPQRFRPEVPLFLFDRENPNGIWTLEVRDSGPIVSPTRTLNSWELFIKTNQ